jgi:hypothetical protein
MAPFLKNKEKIVRTPVFFNIRIENTWPSLGQLSEASLSMCTIPKGPRCGQNNKIIATLGQ